MSSYLFSFVPNPYAFLFATTLLAVLIIVFRAWRRLALPPGPRSRLPFGFGSSNSGIPQRSAWTEYTEWKELYGPIATFTQRNRRMIVLNTAQASIDLIEKRARLYSDRPRSLITELCGYDDRIFSLAHTDPRFSTHRKLFHGEFGHRFIGQHLPTQEKETRTFLRNILHDPRNFRSHVRRYAVAVIMKIAYGYTVKEDNDQFVGLVQSWLEHTNAHNTKPAQWAVDSYPFLKYLPRWIPGTAFFKFADDQRERNRELLGKPVEWVKGEMKAGRAVSSVVERFIRRVQETKEKEGMSREEEDVVENVAGAMYLGGADTTVSALMTFILMMARNPCVQKRAAEEINNVVGTDRLPEVRDMERLPFVGALIKEVLRFHPVAPLALPHRVMEDDVYEGCRIPGGATVIVNLWSILHDESTYPDHMTFDPERYLPNSSDSDSTKPQPDPRNYAFGIGRRICPGMHLAEISLFLIISSTLATFDISPKKDGRGQEIEPKMEWKNGVVSVCEEFECEIRLREGRKLPVDF
ncbi:cytochrome P450 [Sistotremastrum niveocremeum HHB9708]|uniref:Cytochrome P450 n=1 Tax=Sistotremastrum niveocremeum HHB9708 TaxID=1314777 RepID=A0A164PH40_9AGAM|nr:cytochrome P450 [Sistotremastrum niveocremeum HHB9708]